MAICIAEKSRAEVHISKIPCCFVVILAGSFQMPWHSTKIDERPPSSFQGMHFQHKIIIYLSI